MNEDQCHCTTLRKATRRISQLYDKALAETGLKSTQRGILAEIRRTEPVTVGTLADALVMDAGALAHTLKPLERDQLIAIAVDPGDRRSRRVSLTAKGSKKLGETDVVWAKAQQGFERAVGTKRTKAMHAALELLVSNEFMSAFERNIPLAADRS